MLQDFPWFGIRKWEKKPLYFWIQFPNECPVLEECGHGLGKNFQNQILCKVPTQLYNAMQICKYAPNMQYNKREMPI